MRAVDSKSYLIDVVLDYEKERSENEYPFSIPAIRNFDRLELHPNVTFIVGENGSGKSTLIEAIAIALGLNPEGGSKNFRFGTRESHSSFHKHIRVGKSFKKPKDSYFLRAESLFNVATEIENRDKEPCFSPPLINSYGGVSLHEQSHGESFLSLLTKRFFGNGVYLLDEPEAALSPTRQLSALRVINDLVNKSSQFIICTHSPILMAYPKAWIYQLCDEGLKKVDYKDTEHYAVTKEFLDRPERMLQYIFED